MSDFTPTEQQADAIQKITQWYNTGRLYRPVFYLAGFAGVGKTSLTRRAIEDLGIDPDTSEVLFAAYTGKAALVMRNSGLPGATTIHRLIYIPVVDTVTGKVRFILNSDKSPLLEAKLVVLDECSMIDKKLWDDLRSFNVPILVMGDPGQLPPIAGRSVFEDIEPDVFLTEIHRQAKDNPIIWAATQVRQGLPVPHGDYEGKILKLRHTREFTEEAFLMHDQILTGKNATRRRLNQVIKDHLGFTDRYPIKGGVKVICLKNQHDLGLLNGMLFTTLGDSPAVKPKDFHFIQSIFDDEQVYEDLPIYTGHFDEYEKNITEEEHWKAQQKLSSYLKFGATYGSMKPTLLDYGWCLSVHKSQGSGFNTVCLYDDEFGVWDPELRRRWLYTAITRTVDQITILSNTKY